jgi:hypothetical protein
MNKQTIYLIGQISPRKTETYDWRERVRNYFSQREENYNHDTAVETQSIMPPHDIFGDEKMEMPMMVLTAPKEPQFEIFDPCHNDFNKGVREDEMNRVEDVYEVAGLDLIVPKDRQFVARSTICFANLNWYDYPDPLIGTMFELAWYADNSGKAVIGIFDGDHSRDTYCRHPFVRNAVHTWVKNEIDACKIAERYFG